MKNVCWRHRSIEYRFEATHDPLFTVVMYSDSLSRGFAHVSARNKTKTKPGPKKNKKKIGNALTQKYWSYRIQV